MRDRRLLTHDGDDPGGTKVPPHASTETEGSAESTEQPAASYYVAGGMPRGSLATPGPDRDRVSSPRIKEA